MIENYGREDQTYIIEDYDLDPSKDQWFSGFSIKINNPITIQKIDNETILVCNYFLKEIKGAFLAVSNEKGEMPIYYFEDFKPLHYYKMHIPIDKLTSFSKNLNKNNIQFKMINLGEDFEKLNKVDVCWKVQIPLKYDGCNRKHSRAEIQNLLTQITDFAYILQSKEFAVVCENFESIDGKKLDKLPYRLENGNRINQNEDQRCWNFQDPAQKKFFYDVLGVHSSTYGGTRQRDTFNCGYENPGFYGRGVTLGSWSYTNLSASVGVAWYNRPNEMSNICESIVVGATTVHEMAHMFGYLHYSCLCMGPLGENDIKVVQTLGYLLRKELPYYDILPKETISRCGFNKLEKWIYENSNKFENSNIEKYIEDEIEARNKAFDENQRIFNSNKSYRDAYEEFKRNGQLALFSLIYQGKETPFKFTGLDREIFNNYGDINYFMKLTKKNKDK